MHYRGVAGDVLRACAGLGLGTGVILLVISAEGRFMAHVDSDPRSDVARMYRWLGRRSLRWGFGSLLLGVLCFFASAPF